MNNIPEGDWKYLKRIKDEILKDVCGKVFLDIEKISQERKGQKHDSYLKIWDLLRKKDREISDMFDDLKRSNAILKIANMLDSGALQEHHFLKFTELTKDEVNSIVELRKEL